LNKGASLVSATLIPSSPKGNFLLGHLTEYRKNPLGFLTACARDYGDIVALRLLGSRVYLLNHPRYIEAVLSDDTNFISHKGMRLRPTQCLLGNGLLTSDGNFWRGQRRIAQPAFHHARIVAYGAVMVEYAERMLASWQDGETRDVFRDMLRLTQEIVAKTLFDADVTDDSEDIAAAFDTLQEEFNAERSLFQSLRLASPLPVNRRTREAVKQLDETIYRIIQRRRTDGCDAGDLLSMLLAARREDGSQLTERQLRDEVMTIFFAGHEATGATLAWALYLLARHPEAQSNLCAEIQEVLNGRAPRATDVPRLRYTARVVKETLRLYPPAWALGREAVRDCTIGGYRVPARTQLMMSQWVMHRDARYFDSPDEFRPERWTDQMSAQLPKYAYFPYGGRARGCIGRAFAEMEMVLILAIIAREYEFNLAPDFEPAILPSFALIPKNKIKLTLMKTGNRLVPDNDLQFQIAI
jgi:cytochrome P450